MTSDDFNELLNSIKTPEALLAAGLPARLRELPDKTQQQAAIVSSLALAESFGIRQKIADQIVNGYGRQQGVDVFGRAEYAGNGAIDTRAALELMPALVRASEVPYEPPRWVLAPYFQIGKGTLIQGDNGSGKTAFMCGVAAHITTGRALLNSEVAAPGNVLMLSVEDDLPVLRGRIEANGGDLTKVHFMTNAAGMTFTSPAVEEAIKLVHPSMVIFDPFQAFLGAGVDMFRANETRPQLAKLFELCAREGCCCAIIAHMGKNADRSPVNRSLGSVDIPAAMRSILQLVKDPDAENGCIMVHIKCSNAPKGRAIAYTIGDRGGVCWTGYKDMTADDIVIAAQRKEKGIPYENEPLVKVFNQLVTDNPGGGFWSYAKFKEEGAKILGYPPYSDLGDLRQRLDNGLARELQKRDGLIVVHGAKGKNNVRGIRVEKYETPKAYQRKLDI